MGSGKSALLGGVGKAPATGGPGAGRAAPGGTASGISKDQANVVTTMQQLMGQFGIDLSSAEKAQAAIKKLNVNIKPEDLTREARSWGATRIGTSGTATGDGEWGPNTKTALLRIKKFVTDNKVPNVLIQEGQGNSPWHEMKDADIIKMAEANIANLSRLFAALGLETPAVATGRGKSNTEYDRVPRVLTQEAAGADPWPKHYGGGEDNPTGGILITAGSLSTFDRFFQILETLTIQGIGCAPLSGRDAEAVRKGRGEERGKKRRAFLEVDIQKLASEILDGCIVRLAQNNPHDPSVYAKQPQGPTVPVTQPGANQPHVPTAPMSPPRAAGAQKTEPAPLANVDKGTEKAPAAQGSLCVNMIDAMMRWFRDRSAMVYQQIVDASREAGEIHPIKVPAQRLITDEDVRAAGDYRASINELSNLWARIRRQLLANAEVDENTPTVTREMIVRSGGGEGREGGPGAGRGAPGGSGYTVPGESEAGDYLQDQGPIRDYIPLSNLGYDQFSNEAVNVLKDDSANVPDLDIREWQQGLWTQIADRYIPGDSEYVRWQAFPGWARKVTNAINGLFLTWRDKNPAPEIMVQQQRKLEQWTSTIQATTNRALRQMQTMLGKAEQPAARATRR